MCILSDLVNDFLYYSLSLPHIRIPVYLDIEEGRAASKSPH